MCLEQEIFSQTSIPRILGFGGFLAFPPFFVILNPINKKVVVIMKKIVSLLLILVFCRRQTVCSFATVLCSAKTRQ